MSIVPKLNYASNFHHNQELRNHSKGKNSEQSSSRKGDPEDSLFSHMNKDNLNYIQSQIREKNRKAPHQRAKSSMETMEEQPKKPFGISHRQKSFENQKIQQQQSKLESTERRPQIQIKASEQPEDQKLSSYEIPSNSKSQRINSIEASLQANTQQKHAQFITFLEGYIDKLHRSPKREKSKHSMVDIQLSEEMLPSSSKKAFKNPNKFHQKERQREDKYISQKLQGQKMESMMLARDLEKYKISQNGNQDRIYKLEDQMAMLTREVSQLRNRALRQNFRREQQAQFFRYQQENERKLVAVGGQNFNKNLIDIRSRRKTESESLQKLEEQYHFFKKSSLLPAKMSYSTTYHH